MLLLNGESALLHQRTALKASPWGEAGECNEPDEGACYAEMQVTFYAGKCGQPKAFPLEGKVLNAVKRMRCSRRSGVILYIALLTAAAQPTPHQSALADSFSSRRSLLVSAFFNSR